MTTIELPVTFEAIVECPRCRDTVGIAVSLHGRLVADDDGSGSLGVRTDARKVDHVCAQMRLSDYTVTIAGGSSSPTVSDTVDDDDDV